MKSECALEAQWGSYAGVPTGSRKLTPGTLQASRVAEQFKGLPEGVKTPAQLLAAVKKAAPRLGLSIRLVYALDWLFGFTRPQDWEEGYRPVVWPSAREQQLHFGLSKSGIKSLNRALVEAGLIIMKDSPNGKRYGHRDRQGRIIEAYGFDLSPLAARHEEFVRLAEEAKDERELNRHLRRRQTIARKAITQIFETVAQSHSGDEAWLRLQRKTQGLIETLRQTELPEELATGVATLERLQVEARLRLDQLLDAVNCGPKGPENKPHILTTNQLLILIKIQ